MTSSSSPLQQQLAGHPLVAQLDGRLPTAFELGVLARSGAPLVLSASTLAPVLAHIRKEYPHDQIPYVVLLDSEQDEDESRAAQLLNDGAEALLTSNTRLLDAPQSLVPSERIILSVQPESAALFKEKGLQLAGLHVTIPSSSSSSTAPSDPNSTNAAAETSSSASPENRQSLLQTYASLLDTKASGRALYVSLAADGGAAAATVQDVVQLAAAEYGATLLAPFSTLHIAPAPSSAESASAEAAEESAAKTPEHKLDYAAALFAPLRSDRPDGLIATVVSTSLGQSLGLVYSSRASLRHSLLTAQGTYHSRKRGLWHKGATSGATQTLEKIRFDCDFDAVEFRVVQHAGHGGEAFCHLPVRASCFGPLTGLERLESTIAARRAGAPQGSYTARLFSDSALLSAKLREEAQELLDAADADKEHVAFEMADLLYFALVRCAKAGVSLRDVERALEGKAKKVQRRKGDAKPAFVVNGSASSSSSEAPAAAATGAAATTISTHAAPADVNGSAATAPATSDRIEMTSYRLEDLSAQQRVDLLKRPSIKSGAIMDIARPILASVREGGDKALLALTAKFDRCTALTSPILRPPFVNDAVLAKIKPEVKEAIDVAYGNIYRFHKAQKQTAGNVRASEAGVAGLAGVGEDEADAVLEMETQPGVVCRRFARPIQRVGLYVPGGSAVLPSTALMLGVPALVAKCPTVVLATPPRPDGSIAPEVLYVADKVRATHLLAAGGAQAVAAMAYGTESCPKVDKIVGPGNQFVTAAKMIVQNETDTLVSIDMPAGPSEVLVIADRASKPAFVASDLLSQAEHGPDSQVVLVAIGHSAAELKAIEDELDAQAKRLPRVDVVRKAIEKSVTIVVQDRQQAVDWSNAYAPEHLILQVEDAEEMVKHIENAGSIFVGQWSPER